MRSDDCTTNEQIVLAVSDLILTSFEIHIESVNSTKTLQLSFRRFQAEII